jgi:hypothetical protein
MADADADANTPITKAILDEVVDKLVKLVGNNSKKLDADMAEVRQEIRLISASVKNVQTQVLESQGRFDTNGSTLSGPSAAPSHKLRFPKFKGSDDPITWLHKGEILPRLRHARSSQGSHGVVLPGGRRESMVLLAREEPGRPILAAIRRGH